MTNTDPPYYSCTTNSTGDYWITIDYQGASYPGTAINVPSCRKVRDDPEVDKLKAKLTELEERLNKPSRGVDMKALYKVTLCYGEDRVKPIVQEFAPVIADGEEDAKIKSGVFAAILTSWDPDFLTIICAKIGEVKVKERAKEVKQV